MEIQGFVKRGFEEEIDLMAILPARDRAFSTKDEQERVASAWEAEKGQLVRRPWEDAAQHAARKKEFKFKPIAQVAEGIQLPPVIAEREMRKYLYELDTNEDMPEKRRAALELTIHQLERQLGREETNFTERRKGKQKVIEEMTPTEQERLTKFRAATDVNKKRVLAKTTKADIRWMKVARDTEERPDIVDDVVERLALLEMN